MKLRTHLIVALYRTHGVTGRTACNIDIRKNPRMCQADSEWDVATGRISRGCVAVTASVFQPDQYACTRCATHWERGEGIHSMRFLQDQGGGR